MRRGLYHRSALCSILTVAWFGTAMPARASDNAELWLGAGASGRIAGPVDASIDVIQRHGDATDGLYQRVLSGMVGYRLSRDLSLWAGYVDSRNYEDGRLTVLEHRLRQDIRAVVARPGKGEVAVRLRAEERWRDATPGTGWRVRLQARYARPFVGPTRVFVSHESFVNLDSTQWGQRAGWERMRNAVGLQIPLSTAVRVEAGYLNQFVRRPGADEDAHVGTLNLHFGW